jgi:hypothetical protein
MDVCVLPWEYRLHVDDPAGLQTDWSSKLVRLEPTVELGYMRGRERPFEFQVLLR